MPGHLDAAPQPLDTEAMKDLRTPSRHGPAHVLLSAGAVLMGALLALLKPPVAIAVPLVVLWTAGTLVWFLRPSWHLGWRRDVGKKRRARR